MKLILSFLLSVLFSHINGLVFNEGDHKKEVNVQGENGVRQHLICSFNSFNLSKDYRTDRVGTERVGTEMGASKSKKRVRRMTGLRTHCISRLKKYCKLFTVRGVSKVYCTFKKFYMCTALD